MHKHFHGDPTQVRLRWAKASLQPLLDDQFIGRKLAGNFAEYTIIMPIAEGGNSRVYQAIQTTRKDVPTIVALKVLAKDAREISPEDKTGFVDELRVMLMLKHPNIVRVFDFGEHDDALFLVSEYVAGPSIRNIIDRLYPLPLRYTREALCQLCSGLGALHKEGLVYRDMKPGNVICTNSDMQTNEGILVKIVDFGAVSPATGIETESGAGVIIGTPQYMAPEQFGNSPYDHRVDIYALGLVAYELLTGAPPFGGGFLDLMRQHMAATPKPPSEMAPAQRISEHIDALVLKALAKEPGERYRTADEFADALRNDWPNGGWR